jgi:hypothetical protein
VPTDALFAAPLLVAAVLVASAVGKLRDPRRAALGFDALRVPQPLARPWIRAAHPWAEILLALCLVLSSGPAAIVTAVVATALFVAYLSLVVRAAQSPEPTDCACFGSAGSERVSGLTVARNVWLLALSGVSLWVPFSGRSPLQWAVGAGPDAWWLAAVAAAAVTTGLILYHGPASPPASARDSEGAMDDEDLEDYERTEIPHAPVTLANGEVVSLRELAVARPKLLLAVSETCSSCHPTIEAAPTWRARLPALDIHLLFLSAAVTDTAEPSQPETLHDPMRFAFEALQLPGTPSAVLLGVDGMLAGGPVAGHDAIRAFVADIETELAAPELLSTSS